MNDRTDNTPTRYRPWRRLSLTTWRTCHRYLALLAGLPLAVIALSGGLSVYRDAVDRWLNPALVIESGDQPMASLDRIIDEVRRAHPNRHGAWTLEMPDSPNSAVTVWFDNPHESIGKYYAPLMVSVNPYTGQVIASRFWGDTFSTWLVDLHSRLLFDEEGGKLMTVLSICLCVLTVSGLYLWWPRNRPMLISLVRVRFDNGLMALLIDIHRLLGVSAAGLLLLLAFTGFNLSYPDLLASLTASGGMTHGDAGPNVQSTATPNDRPINLTEAVLVARGLFPHAEVRRISTPRGELGTYRVNLRQTRELSQKHPFTTVWIDRWSGQIRAVNNPGQFSPGQTFATWQWSVHTGEAFGLGSLWLALGFTPLTLLITGITSWLHRIGVVADKKPNWRNIGRQVIVAVETKLFQSMTTLRYRVYPAVRSAFTRLASAIKKKLR